MEERIKIYLGDTYLRPFSVDLNLLEGNQRPLVYCYNDMKYQGFPTGKTTYYHDLTRFIHPHSVLYDTKFLFYPFDRVEPFRVPTLVKSRLLYDQGNSILLNMNYMRHFKSVFEIKSLDIPFQKKKDVIVWRGGCTGYGFGNNIPVRDVSRQQLIESFATTKNPSIDIGLAQFDKKKYKDFLQYQKPQLKIKEQLEYKFILSVEGNDVASNLKWILQSNSVPFCPPFSVQSWILEDRLIPFEHFIPLKPNFGDLEEKVEWAKNHPELCEKIAQNGKEYMKQFLDLEQEDLIQKEILTRYSQNVNVLNIS